MSVLSFKASISNKLPVMKWNFPFPILHIVLVMLFKTISSCVNMIICKSCSLPKPKFTKDFNISSKNRLMLTVLSKSLAVNTSSNTKGAIILPQMSVHTVLFHRNTKHLTCTAAINVFSFFKHLFISDNSPDVSVIKNYLKDLTLLLIVA